MKYFILATFRVRKNIAKIRENVTTLFPEVQFLILYEKYTILLAFKLRRPTEAN